LKKLKPIPWTKQPTGALVGADSRWPTLLNFHISLVLVLGFLFSTLCQIGNRAQDKLAKIGYTSERKVKQFKNPTIFWQPTGTYLSKYDNFKKQILKSGNFGAIFFTKNFCMNHIEFFFVTEYLAPKKMLGPRLIFAWYTKGINLLLTVL